MAAAPAPTLLVPAPARGSRYDDPEVIATIKDTVAKGATDAQLRMFLEICKATGLNPFLREIWFVAETGRIMAGRDGYLRVANENPMFDGMETRVERDSHNVPVKATCSVWRKDRSHAITCEAYYSEYVKGSPVWRNYPSAMISKVAEVLALKRSFAINGVVTEEEIGTGDAPAAPAARGSKEAAQSVAEAKIAAMRNGASYSDISQADPRIPRKPPQPAAEIIEAMPADDELPACDEEAPEESDLERNLRESIELAGARKQRYATLRAFSDIKRRLRAVGALDTYYRLLGMYGASHSNDLEIGSPEARECYKRMLADVRSREERAAREGSARP
jgi:phage recombination protein Bet